ncbi:hypothetical protein OMP38_27810 [Cohnella ginsengisoli]|uniref:Uncharacterized protein n=1 Tax=Cohnella ginsengisoli TaxID=425004 RepID=A0A9X4KLF5_9BACL|nr:hypothetical protein [Cohnella ginsengisoli]MDG0794218.1 hypothetical protein [Cohnella ginsengisoli]
MVYVTISIVVGALISLAYLVNVWISFRQVSRDRQSEQRGRASEAAVAEDEAWFSWKAFVSIVASSAILYSIGKWAFLWNYVPFIAIGSAVAVIAAFTFERRKRI